MKIKIDNGHAGTYSVSRRQGRDGWDIQHLSRSENSACFFSGGEVYAYVVKIAAKMAIDEGQNFEGDTLAEEEF